jgi:hypothetical protein
MFCRKKLQVNVLFLVGTKTVEKSKKEKNQLFSLKCFDTCYEYASYFYRLCKNDTEIVFLGF